MEHVTIHPLALAEARWRRDEVLALVAALRASEQDSGPELRALLDELEDLEAELALV